MELYEDKYSNTIWGTDNQLTILGHYTKPNLYDKYSYKIYVLECVECSKDQELFPLGSITSNMDTLKRGGNPCACYSHTVWKEDQYKVMTARAAAEIGVKFLGWDGDYDRCKTKSLMECPKHGLYSTSSIRDFLSKLYGCPKCKGDAVAARVRKSDEDCIEAFMKSGAFHENTKFWRSDTTDKNGWKFLWYVDCPDCGEIGEGYRVNLERGHKPCSCTNRRQKQAYINLIYDNEQLVALKFGIAIKVQERVTRQNRKSIYDITNYGTWEFSSTLDCAQAERDCKMQLKCGVIPKGEMIDGFSETTLPLNLEDIIDIYERNGGVRIQNEN